MKAKDLLVICSAIIGPAYGFLPTSTSILRQKQHRNTAIFTSETPPEEDDDMPEEARKMYDRIAEKFLASPSDSDFDFSNFSDFPSAFPRNPFGSGLDQTGGKGGLYSDDELFSVLTLHDELSDDDDDTNEVANDNDISDVATGMENPLAGIHDLVTNALKNNDPAVPSFGLSAQVSEVQIDFDDDLKRKMAQIRAIASDVDGTIMTSKQTVHPRTRLAILRAIKESASNGKIQFFFPATGKSRKGALDSLGIEIGNLIAQNCAGVYLQGLFCVDTEGNVVFERKLDRLAVDAAEALVEETGVSIVAYDGDDLYTTEQTDIVVHVHEFYGEPLPVLLPKSEDEAVRKLSTHEPSMHKLLIMDDDVEKLTNIVRPKLEELARKHGACVTQAIPTMLELLPEGCSKAMGLTKLCEALGIDPSSDLLAIGDAENDAGMLEMAAIGVAVGNASPLARDASDFVVDFTNDEGGAGFAMELFAFD